jgi:hypothetical protein
LTSSSIFTCPSALSSSSTICVRNRRNLYDKYQETFGSMRFTYKTYSLLFRPSSRPPGIDRVVRIFALRIWLFRFSCIFVIVTSRRPPSTHLYSNNLYEKIKILFIERTSKLWTFKPPHTTKWTTL